MLERIRKTIRAVNSESGEVARCKSNEMKKLEFYLLQGLVFSYMDRKLCYLNWNLDN